MDLKRDYAANDGANKTSSPFVFFLLFPRAIHTAGRHTLSPPTEVTDDSSHLPAHSLR